MKRATLNVDTVLAFHTGEDRHPQVVVREFCHRHGVRVLDAQFETTAGTWTFEVEAPDSQMPLFPPHITARPHR